MYQDSDPAQHPQTGGLLGITQVDPGEERHQNTDHCENNKFFKPRGHIGFATPLFLAGIKNRQRKRWLKIK
jgi:hypothetical protein